MSTANQITPVPSLLLKHHVGLLVCLCLGASHYVCLPFTEPELCTITRVSLSANTEWTGKGLWGVICWIWQNIYGFRITYHTFNRSRFNRSTHEKQEQKEIFQLFTPAKQYDNIVFTRDTCKFPGFTFMVHTLKRLCHHTVCHAQPKWQQLIFGKRRGTIYWCEQKWMRESGAWDSVTERQATFEKISLDWNLLYILDYFKVV